MVEEHGNRWELTEHQALLTINERPEDDLGDGTGRGHPIQHRSVPTERELQSSLEPIDNERL